MNINSVAEIERLEREVTRLNEAVNKLSVEATRLSRDMQTRDFVIDHAYRFFTEPEGSGAKEAAYNNFVYMLGVLDQEKRIAFGMLNAPKKPDEFKHLLGEADALAGYNALDMLIEIHVQHMMWLAANAGIKDVRAQEQRAYDRERIRQIFYTQLELRAYLAAGCEPSAINGLVIAGKDTGEVLPGITGDGTGEALPKIARDPGAEPRTYTPPAPPAPGRDFSMRDKQEPDA